MNQSYLKAFYSLVENEPSRDTSDSEGATRCMKVANIKAAIRVMWLEQEMMASPDKATGQPCLHSEICDIQSQLFFIGKE